MINSIFASVGHEPRNIIEVASCPSSAFEFGGRGLGVGLVHSICASAKHHRETTQIELSELFGKLEVGLITPPRSWCARRMRRSSKRVVRRRGASALGPYRQQMEATLNCF